MKETKSATPGTSGGTGQLLVAAALIIAGIAAAVWVYAADRGSSCTIVTSPSPTSEQTGPSGSTPAGVPTVTTAAPATSQAPPSLLPETTVSTQPSLQPTLLPGLNPTGGGRNGFPGGPGVNPGGTGRLGNPSLTRQPGLGASQGPSPTSGRSEVAGIGTEQVLGPNQTVCQQGSGVGAAVVALAELVAGGIAVALIYPRRGGEPKPAVGDFTAGPPPDDRAAMITTLLWLRDRQTSTALTDKVDADLSRLGVRRRDLLGQPFDPTWQEASRAVPTTDSHSAGLIAEVQVDAWFDGETLVRAPIVSVYRLGAGQ